MCNMVFVSFEWNKISDRPEILFQVAVLRFYKTKRFAVFRKFRVISMRFAVFLTVLFCAVFYT